MSDQNGIDGELERQARCARRIGWMVLLVAIVIGLFLVWLFLGRSLPHPFIFGVSAFGDHNAVLGDVLPTVIGTLIERVGAVAVGLFMIQVLLGFVRYHFRLATHLSMLAKMLRIAGGNTDDLAKLSVVLLPSYIDFGRAPNSPIDSIVHGLAEVTKEALRLRRSP